MKEHRLHRVVRALLLALGFWRVGIQLAAHVDELLRPEDFLLDPPGGPPLLLGRRQHNRAYGVAIGPPGVGVVLDRWKRNLGLTHDNHGLCLADVGHAAHTLVPCIQALQVFHDVNFVGAFLLTLERLEQCVDIPAHATVQQEVDVACVKGAVRRIFA